MIKFKLTNDSGRKNLENGRFVTVVLGGVVSAATVVVSADVDE